MHSKSLECRNQCKFAMVAVAAVLAAQAGHSSTLTGDVISYTLTQGIPIQSGTVPVGSGPEVSVYGLSSLTVDLNAGVDGNIFEFLSESAYFSFNGIGPDPVVWTFSDLQFSDGSLLTGFEILSTLITSPISVVTTQDALTISYAPQDHRPGAMIRGQFMTSPIASQVPLPGTLLLLMSAIGIAAIAHFRPRLMTA